MTDNRTTELLKGYAFALRRLEYAADKPGSNMTLGEYEAEEKKITDEYAQAIAATLGSMDKSRWHELFGTPEKATRTICRQLKHFNICICDGCPVKPPNKDCDSEYDALLEWMMGDAE